MIDHILYWTAVACIAVIIDVLFCWAFFPSAGELEDYRG